ncbi:phytoene desaturase family protein [Sutcliffiella sp. NC1]|uniref:phytoene desaturase family protein n=1 Tax=Sutcliffiella sp. NC1 TaxID=3004096 RepID=UPI0022DE5849|nr:FAD-dependent oxidoreductase [Sutcliffiella sp. NC1]WBL16575.1 FAD-dependent oxidoreductase [Sutcliffiella sp. NC1]
MKNTERNCVVIGGGIAGLTASIYLARAGLSVTLIEKAKTIGGRAKTEVMDGSYVNFGPHALYSKGKSLEILAELSISPKGNSPAIGGKVFYNDSPYNLPANPFSVLTSDLFNWRGKMELLRFFILLQTKKLKSNREISVDQWLHENIKDERVQKFILMLIRLSSYCNDPDRLRAEVAFKQLQLGKAIYVHNGWQSIIEELKEKAEKLGVIIQAGASVQQIKGKFPQFEVKLSNNKSIFTPYILSTASPNELRKFLQGYEIDAINELIPVRAACLDIVLNNIPNPTVSFALSMDHPLYFSNHSNVATLSDNQSHSVIHVMKYLSINEPRTDLKPELEQFLSRVQPGWEKHVISKRYLPNITVTNSMMKKQKNEMEQIPGLFIAGDWVGAEGMLVDSSFFSAKQAAMSIIELNEKRECSDDGNGGSIYAV